MKTWPIILFILCLSCSNEEIDTLEAYTPTPLQLDIPGLFKQKLIAPVIPTNNSLTVEGVALGKKLFFDPQLSGNNTQSCADCHMPSLGFAESRRVAIGIDDIKGPRNTMPLFNLAWNYDSRFNWDGKALSLEGQAILPVENPIEMHSQWENVITKLQADSQYPNLFFQAFGTNTITQTLTVKAIAQFERTLISGNSKFDQYLLNQTQLTAQELNGFNVFMDETKGDCFHCHGSDNNPLWTDNSFHNNGLDENFNDLGLGEITGNPNDNGKFKTPSLRNLTFTAPYMHDGRFNTLEQVINHYSEGLKHSETIDPLMKKVSQGGVHLTNADKADLKAFLLTLSDTSFTNNTNFKQP